MFRRLEAPWSLQSSSSRFGMRSVRVVRRDTWVALATFAFSALVLGACSSDPGTANPGMAPGQWMGAPPNGQARPAFVGPAPSGPGGDAQIFLDAHNRHRAEHCAPPLEWSPQIAAVAQQWADHLAAKGCTLEHSAGALGENLAAATRGSMGPDGAVEMWFQEKGNYDFQRGGFSMSAGHFTQLVWKGTRRLGCGTATCNQMQLWVCNYDPAGNMEGDFQSNVAPPSCRR